MMTEELLNKFSVEEVYECLLKEAASILDLKVSYQDNGCLVKFFDKARNIEIDYIDSNFNFNTIVSTMTTNDKGWCYAKLSAFNVPSVKHEYLSDELLLNYLENGFDTPLVLKPIKGRGGKSVYFVHTKTEMLQAVKSLQGTGTIAVSPLEQYETEYRLTVLDGRIIMAYGKTKTEDNMNNLSCGASVVQLPNGTFHTMSAIAINATRALGLRTANVDMFIGADSKVKIMEVNSSVALKRVACADLDTYMKCMEAYVIMLSSALSELQHLEMNK